MAAGTNGRRSRVSASELFPEQRPENARYHTLAFCVYDGGAMNVSTLFSTISTRRNPDAISQRAYEIWHQEGRPDGCDLRHWLQAEQELSTENAPSGAGGVSDESGNRHGNGNGNGDGRARESTAMSAPPAASSLSIPEIPPVSNVETLHRPPATDTGGKNSSRGSTSTRKSPRSGRRAGL
jgi:hypothetical protein